jgi:hypothetical protein
MSFLGRIASLGSRFLGRVTPVASYIGRVTPSVLRGIQTAASNPLVGQLASRIGVNPSVLRSVGAAASNVGAGLSLIPGAIHTTREAAHDAMNASAPARQSLAQLYRTVQGGNT